MKKTVKEKMISASKKAEGPIRQPFAGLFKPEHKPKTCKSKKK